jgi:hypothetical protein
MSDLEHPSQSEPQENENWQHRFVDTPELNVSLSPESETHTDDFHRQTGLHPFGGRGIRRRLSHRAKPPQVTPDVETHAAGKPPAHPTESRTEVTYLDRFIDRARGPI